MKSLIVGSASRHKEQGIWSRKNLMKTRLVYRNVMNATWIVKKTPCSQKWCKMGAKGLLSHRDHSFLPWSRKEESRGAIVGVKGQGAHIYVYVRSKAQSKDSK